MKKLAILLAATMMLTACTSMPDNSSSAVDGEPLAVEEITYSSGEGFYTTLFSYDNKVSNIVYIDGKTATQKAICTRSNCAHTDASCASLPLGYLRGYYNNSLIYISSLSDMNDPSVAAVSFYISDINGEGYTELCTVDQALTGSDIAMYGDELLFVTSIDDKHLLHSVNIKTKAVRQISPEPFYGAHTFLGGYKNYLFYQYVAPNDTTQPYNIIRINVTTGVVTTIYQQTNPLDWDYLNRTNQTFTYYDGKIYTLLPITANGTNPLHAIDCITGEVSVVDDTLEFNSPNGQSLYLKLDDSLIINTIINANDSPTTPPRRFAYDLSESSKTMLTVMAFGGDGRHTNYPLTIHGVFGEYILVDYTHTERLDKITNEDGTVTEIPVRTSVKGIISVADYLSNTPNFREITITN